VANRLDFGGDSDHNPHSGIFIYYFYFILILLIIVYLPLRFLLTAKNKR